MQFTTDEILQELREFFQHADIANRTQMDASAFAAYGAAHSAFEALDRALCNGKPIPKDWDKAPDKVWQLWDNHADSWTTRATLVNTFANYESAEFFLSQQSSVPIEELYAKHWLVRDNPNVGYFGIREAVVINNDNRRD